MAVKRSASSTTVLPLMELATSFWGFKTLAAATELELFTKLSGTKGTTSAGLAKTLAIAERPAEMLLTGCAALGLLKKRGPRYVNSPMAERFLVRGAPQYFGGFIEMLDKRLYAGWGKLTEALRSNAPTTWDPGQHKSLFDGVDPVMLEHFWQAMHSISSSTGDVLARTLDWKRFRRVLDVGGGSGALDIELCRRHRHLRATVYDLPFVVETAAANIERAGLTQRVSTIGGDFFADAAYPTGHDAILLSLIMHDWSEADDRRILQKCYAALPSGGAVMICELLVNEAKSGPAPAALMSLNMLIETTGGRNYTAGEYGAWLRDIGFRRIRTVRLAGAGADGVVIGYKP
jgi:predicted O-methyltransferase YrrM